MDSCSWEHVSSLETGNRIVKAANPATLTWNLDWWIDCKHIRFISIAPITQHYSLPVAPINEIVFFWRAHEHWRKRKIVGFSAQRSDRGLSLPIRKKRTYSELFCIKTGAKCTENGAFCQGKFTPDLLPKGCPEGTFPYFRVAISALKVSYLRERAVAHNPKVVGSNPTPATK